MQDTNCRFSTGEALRDRETQDWGRLDYLTLGKTVVWDAHTITERNTSFKAEFNRISKNYSIDLEKLACCRKGGSEKTS
jgi:hypothetical protein